MQIPEICPLNSDITLQEIRNKAPFYVPEWNTENENDFGIALSNVFSRMAEIISSRLNEAPKKHFLSFLEMINASLVPASTARVPLTFVLSEGAPKNVLIESSTQASADGPDGKPVIFETENNILATPSKLVSIYSVIKEKDQIFENTRAVNGVEPTELFTAGENLQMHSLYIGDENLLNIKEGVISIDFGKIGTEMLNKLVSKIENDGSVNWEYGVKLKEKKGDEEVEVTKWFFLGSTVIEDKVEITKETLAIEGEKYNEGVVISDKVKVNSVESRWIRCQVCENRIDEFNDLKLNRLKISVSPPTISPESGSAIVPDSLFYNDIPIQILDNSFFPFGKKPYIYDTFYIGSKDAFSKKGYKVTLTFGLRPGKPSLTSEADNPLLSWEYWDGESWNLLEIQDLDDKNKNFINLSESTKCKKSMSSQEKSLPIKVNLTISEMPEVKLSRVNGKENYWIRVRLFGGNYGKEYEITYPKGNIKNKHYEVIRSTFCPPEITNLMIDYKDKKKNGTIQGKQPEFVFAENNLVISSCLEKLKANTSDFSPFVPFPDPDILPAVYFGFDKELEKGPISLFIDVAEESTYQEYNISEVRWQYLTAIDPEVWKDLEVVDETEGITKKGMVQFNVSEKMKAASLFGLGDRYWIKVKGKFPTFERHEGEEENKKQKLLMPSKMYGKNYPNSIKKPKIVLHKGLIKKGKGGEERPSLMLKDNRDFEFTNHDLNKLDSREFPLKVLGFYPNSVWAVQSRRIYDEIIGSGRGEKDQKFKLISTPATKEEIWVNEINALSEKEKNQLLKNSSNIKLKQDNKGNIEEFWVKWTRVNGFLESKSRDRHYTIDWATGEVFFGDGKNGMVPPIGFNNVKATYSVGGGSSGNLGAKSISKLQSSIVYVDNVYNPIISDGGTEIEDIEALIKRAPNAIRNRNRAIAVEDYEWLAKEASVKIAKVKGLPNLKPVLQTEPSYKIGSDSEKISTGCVKIIIVPESLDPKPVPSYELKRRITSYLKERCPPVVTLSVIPPSYVRIDVSAELITNAIDKTSIIEMEAKNKISEFLHPLRGSTERKGWSFGCAPCVSDIYSLLGQIKDVNCVNKVAISFYKDLDEDSQGIKLNDECSMVKLPNYALPYSGMHKITVKCKNCEKEG
jgi:hypothetical protein